MIDLQAKIKQIEGRSGVISKNYKVPKGTGFKYIKYRVLRPLLKWKYNMYRRKGDLPWLTPTSIEFFKEYLDGSQIGCEFGSGASTIFFSSRSKKIVSIEHYKPWFDKVNAGLEKNSSDVVDYRFIEKQEPTDPRSSIEVFPDVEGIDKYDFRKDYVNYFNALSNDPDEYFDFIIVDGRARPECVFASIPKLKKGGLMVLDNSERDRYKIVFNHLKNWDMADTTTGLTNTTFWVKPNE